MGVLLKLKIGLFQALNWGTFSLANWSTFQCLIYSTFVKELLGKELWNQLFLALYFHKKHLQMTSILKIIEVILRFAEGNYAPQKFKFVIYFSYGLQPSSSVFIPQRKSVERLCRGNDCVRAFLAEGSLLRSCASRLRHKPTDRPSKPQYTDPFAS